MIDTSIIITGVICITAIIIMIISKIGGNK